MKYFPRLGIYKASNVTFDPKTYDSFSYGWWLMFAKIKGKNVFNDYGYSMTTRRHQRKLRKLLNNLGIKIDLFVQAPRGLQNLQDALECHKAIDDQFSRYIAKKRIRHENRKHAMAAQFKNRDTMRAIEEFLKGE